MKFVGRYGIGNVTWLCWGAKVVVVETVVEVFKVLEVTDPHETKNIETRKTDNRDLDLKPADLPTAVGTDFVKEWAGRKPLETETQRNGCERKYDDERDRYPV